MDIITTIPPSLYVYFLITTDNDISLAESKDELVNYYVYWYGHNNVIKIQADNIPKLMYVLFNCFIVPELSKIPLDTIFQQYTFQQSLSSKEYIDQIKISFQSKPDAQYLENDNDNILFCRLPIIKLYNDVQGMNQVSSKEELDILKQPIKSLKDLLVCGITYVFFYLSYFSLIRVYKKDSKKLHTKIKEAPQLLTNLNDLIEHPIMPLMPINSLLIKEQTLLDTNAELYSYLNIYFKTLIEQVLKSVFSSSLLGVHVYNNIHGNRSIYGVSKIIRFETWINKFKIKCMYFKYISKLFFNRSNLFEKTKNFFLQIKKKFFPFDFASSLIIPQNINEILDLSLIELSTQKKISFKRYKQFLKKTLSKYIAVHSDWLTDTYFTFYQSINNSLLVKALISVLVSTHEQYEQTIMTITDAETHYFTNVRNKLSLVKPSSNTYLH